MVIKQKKESIHATVSPYIKRKAEELVESEEFSSMSDLVSIALAEFVGKYNREQKINTASKTDISIVADIINAGIALVEAGKYEEAKKCFAKVKEFESEQPPEQEKKIDQKGKDEYIGEVIFD